MFKYHEGSDRLKKKQNNQKIANNNQKKPPAQIFENMCKIVHN